MLLCLDCQLALFTASSTVHLLTVMVHRTWSIASVIGPVVGGSLASGGQWRWIFCGNIFLVTVYKSHLPTDLNLPITAVSALLVLIFLKLPTPAGTFWEKFARLDWM